MSLVVQRLAAPGPHGPLLHPTSFVAPSGVVTLVAGDPGPGGISLALALAGRLHGAEGEVLLDDDGDVERRRDAIVLVDLPEVTEPEPSVPALTVLGEELALAGLPARKADILAFLGESQADIDLGQRWEALDPGLRECWLLRLAVLRPGVRALVLTHPDRWGGDPHSWFAQARALAAELDLVIVVTCTHATSRLLGVAAPAEIGVAS